MKKRLSILLLVCMCLSVLASCSTGPVTDETEPATETAVVPIETEAATEAATEAETEPEPDPELSAANVYIVGGTTVGGYLYDHICYARMGLGDYLSEYMYGSMTVNNLAMYGYSSNSFHRTENYDTLEANLKEGDYLIIIFGNEEICSAKDDYTKSRSFANNLYKRFIELAQNAGATPILCTPVVEASADNDYSGEAAHNTDFGDFRQAIVDLGAALNIPVADLTTLTKEKYEAIGYEEAIKYHAVVEGKYYGNSEIIVADYDTAIASDLNERGARYAAYLLASELQKMEGIGTYVRKNIAEPENIGLVAPNYVYAVPVENEVPTEVNIYIAGDSLTAVHAPGYYVYPADSGQYHAPFGYATQLSDYMTENVKIHNYAIGGRSSRSFIEEENYRSIMDNIQAGDYLFIAFGHNDKNTVDEGRFTDATKDHTDPTSIGYYLYEYYIKPAREKGAIPILFTPSVYLDSTDKYTGYIIHDVASGNYPQAIRDVGAAFDVPVVDLLSISRERYVELGYAEAIKYHPALEGKLAEDGVTVEPDLSTIDVAHLSLYGAKYLAYRVACELSNIDGINQYISADLEEPTDIYYTVNPYYVLNQAQ